ncbi:MAG: hypothetical protein EOM34_03110 [Clostridia bacterium]|nr:DUF6063 family protein [Lachnospiraceae bacterium]NCB99652.1 hypothetical protein [Clostridia bacterium]NCD04064.1 hypothetical protein [Clostridia bacterium]
MEHGNLDKAAEIFTKLIVGEEISSNNNVDLYEDYRNNSEVYDILMSLLKKSNLSLYEFGNTLYVTAGDGNRIFGFTNDELKKAIGLRFNRELYLAYFIIYNTILLFYQDSGSFSHMDYVRSEDIITQTDSSMQRALKALQEKALSEVEENSFQTLAGVWEDMPLIPSNEDMAALKAARGSKTGFVKLVFNFLISQDLFFESNGRYYIKPRFRALAENYYEENRGRLYTIVTGGDLDAAY